MMTPYGKALPGIANAGVGGRTQVINTSQGTGVQYGSGPVGPQRTNQLGGGTSYAGTNTNSTFKAGVPPPTPVSKAPPPGIGTTATATSTYSSLPGINTKLQGSMEARLQDQIDNPGMSQATVNQMYSRGAGALAKREAAAQQQLQGSAEAMGFGRSGDLIAGQRSVAGDYSGQRNALRRDLDLGAETDRLNRGMQAVNAATGYLDSQRTQHRADQGMSNQMSNDAWNRNRTAQQDATEAQRYSDSQAWQQQTYADQQARYAEQQRMANLPGFAGGANASDNPRNPTFNNTGNTTGWTPAQQPTQPLPPGTNITSPWLADRRPDLVDANGKPKGTPESTWTPPVPLKPSTPSYMPTINALADFDTWGPSAPTSTPSSGITYGGSTYVAPKKAPGIYGADGAAVSVSDKAPGIYTPSIWDVLAGR